jgi:hypothetical protein
MLTIVIRPRDEHDDPDCPESVAGTWTWELAFPEQDPPLARSANIHSSAMSALREANTVRHAMANAPTQFRPPLDTRHVLELLCTDAADMLASEAGPLGSRRSAWVRAWGDLAPRTRIPEGPSAQ